MSTVNMVQEKYFGRRVATYEMDGGTVVRRVGKVTAVDGELLTVTFDDQPAESYEFHWKTVKLMKVKAPETMDRQVNDSFKPATPSSLPNEWWVPDSAMFFSSAKNELEGTQMTIPVAEETGWTKVRMVPR